MRREISSSITSFYKVSVLLIFVVIISSGLYENLINPDTLGIFLCSLAMLTGFFLLPWVLSLKKIELTDTGIVVSAANFWNSKEIIVPYDQIETVSQSFWTRGSPELVSIRFAAPTPFGDKIWFVPKTRFFPLLRHPVVDEINRLTNRSKGFIT